MDFEGWLNYLEEPVLVLDNSLDVLSFNTAFKSLFPSVKKSEYAGYCLENCPALSELAHRSRGGRREPPEHVVIGDVKYAVFASDISDERGHAVIARSFVLYDVTDYELLVEATAENFRLLQKSNEAIRVQKVNLEQQTRMREKEAAVAEANAILRDLHDTLGHSLTLLNCLSRLALLEPRVEGSARYELEETIRLARISLAELDAFDMLAVGDREKTMTITAFLYRLKQTMLSVSLDVRLTVTGEESQSFESLFFSVTRIIREATTNCLRHAAASVLMISVDFGVTHLRLDIVDNGTTLRGSTVLTMGNGLSGMQRRVLGCGGDIEMGITDNGGVWLRVSLPVESDG